MGKRKNKHKQERDTAFIDMQEQYGGKGGPMKSKKDYTRKVKHKGKLDENG